MLKRKKNVKLKFYTENKKVDTRKYAQKKR